MRQDSATMARSIRRHYRKLMQQAEYLKGACPDCRGHGHDVAGEDCMYCNGTGKTETPAWCAFLLLRGAPRWLVNGETGPAASEEGASNGQ